jgi:imidazolonepropionase-like amidohydrolase
MKVSDFIYRLKITYFRIMNSQAVPTSSILIWPFLLFLFVSFSVGAQSDREGKRRLGSSYFISNTTLVPEPGKMLQDQYILFENGVITAIGKSIRLPPEAVEIKGDSLFVYAGFIDMANKTGVVEPKIPEKPENFDSSSPDPEIAGIHPHFPVTLSYQEDNPHDKEWQKLGFTIAQKLPLGKGMLPGTSALYLYGQEGNNNLLVENQSLYFKFSTVGGVYPNTTLGVMATWRDLVQNARLYKARQSQYALDKRIPRVEKNPVLAALIPVIDREMPVLLETSDELDMRRALKMQEENQLRLILTGVNEGDQLLPLIKERSIGLVLTLHLPADQLSGTEPVDTGDDYDARRERIKAAYNRSLTFAGTVEDFGIPFALTTKHLPRGDFYKNLCLMIQNGLSSEGALAALTVNPARLLGISDIAGTVAEGKMANLLIMSDTLFSAGAKVQMVISDGYVFDYTEISEKSKDEKIIWEYRAETPGGTSSGTWEFIRRKGKWSGSVTYENPEGPGTVTRPTDIEEMGTERMRFSFSVPLTEEKLEVTVYGKISGNSFTGEMKLIGYDNFPVKADKKDKPEKNNEL